MQVWLASVLLVAVGGVDTRAAVLVEAPTGEHMSEQWLALDTLETRSETRPETKPETRPEAKPAVATSTVRRTLPHRRIPRWGNTQLSVRSTTFGEWFRDNYDAQPHNDKFIALVNRLNLGLESRLERVTFGVAARMDTQTLFDVGPGAGLCDTNDDGEVSSVESAECNFDDDYRLERVTLRAETKHTTSILGDFNVNFSRGLGLSVRKIDEIGVDATVKGARFDLRTKPVLFTTLAGFANRQNSDFATRQLLADPGYRSLECQRRNFPLRNDIGNRAWTVCSDLVIGEHVEVRLPGKVRAGAHYAYVGFGESVSTAYDESVHIVGADVARAAIAKRWDIYVGGSGLFRNAPLRRDPALADASYDGYALYASNLITPGTTSILIETKFYRDYLVAQSPTTLQYTEAPTLEREDQAVPAAANAAGGRIRVDHLWKRSGLTLYGNVLAYTFAEQLRDNMFDRDEGAVATHAYAGLIWRKPDSYLSVQASGGYRHESHFQPITVGEDRLRRKFPHAELYITIPVAQRGGFNHSLSVRADGRFETKQVSGFDDNRFAKGNVILGYAMAPFFSAALIGGFSTEFVAPRGEPSLQKKPACPEAQVAGAPDCGKPHLWPGVELRVNFLEGSFVRLFAGRQVGGRICVNGSCRILPDFEGVRADLTLGF